MTPDQQAMYTILKGESCVGCAYLYRHDQGYSNYTVTDTEVRCALNLNHHLGELGLNEPYDWNANADDPKQDNWPATMHSRCHRYKDGPCVRLDVDGEDTLDILTENGLDPDVLYVIFNHAGRTK